MAAVRQSVRSMRSEMGVAEMLHYIRAAGRGLRSQARRHSPGDPNAVIRRLSRLLALAIQQESPLDIAVILGSAAELLYFPDDVAFERCTRTVQRHGDKAMRAVVWAVRHRCARAGAGTQRFVVKGFGGAAQLLPDPKDSKSPA